MLYFHRSIKHVSNSTEGQRKYVHSELPISAPMPSDPRKVMRQNIQSVGFLLSNHP
jgi:hypothetical protein